MTWAWSQNAARQREFPAAVTLFDAAIHYDWRNYRFAINAQNLFDTEHVSACWNFNNACFYGARRNVILSARYRW